MGHFNFFYTKAPAIQTAKTQGVACWGRMVSPAPEAPPQQKFTFQYHAMTFEQMYAEIVAYNPKKWALDSCFKRTPFPTFGEMIEKDDPVALLIDLDPKGPADFPILERAEAFLQRVCAKLNECFESQLKLPLSLADMLILKCPFVPGKDGIGTHSMHVKVCGSYFDNQKASKEVVEALDFASDFDNTGAVEKGLDMSVYTPPPYRMVFNTKPEQKERPLLPVPDWQLHNAHSRQGV